MQKEMHLWLKKAQKGLLYRKVTVGKKYELAALKKKNRKFAISTPLAPGISRIL